MKLCQMVVDVCAEKPSYETLYGSVAQHFCTLNKQCILHFEKVFQNQYEITHYLSNVKLINMAQFFAHLIASNSISCRGCIHY